MNDSRSARHETREPHATRRVDRALGIVAALLAVGWSVLGLYVAHSQMPPNALELPFEAQVRPLARILAPEGWNFFTRNPREERALPFMRHADGTWASAHAGPHAQARYAFGLNRVSRAQGVEIGLLLGGIPSSAWEACQESISTCLASGGPVMHLRNVSPAPTLCGDVGLALEEPLPWAWIESRDEVTMPSRVARLDVTC